MNKLFNITHRHPEILGGTTVLEGGDTLEEFLHQFPSVKREQAIAVLNAAYELITANAYSAV